MTTIKQARKALGGLAENISDDELEKELKVAELFKALYLNNVLSNNKTKHGNT